MTDWIKKAKAEKKSTTPKYKGRPVDFDFWEAIEILRSKGWTWKKIRDWCEKNGRFYKQSQTLTSAYTRHKRKHPNGRPKAGGK